MHLIKNRCLKRSFTPVGTTESNAQHIVYLTSDKHFFLCSCREHRQMVVKIDLLGFQNLKVSIGASQSSKLIIFIRNASYILGSQ